MQLGKCGSRGGHHIGDAALKKADHVKVAFDNNHFAFFGDTLFAMVQPKKNVSLEIELCFGAVHILGVAFSREVAAAECNDDARHILDGDHQAVTELVRDASIFLLDGKSRFHAVQRRKTVLHGVSDKAFASVGRVSDMESLASLVGNVTA